MIAFSVVGTTTPNLTYGTPPQPTKTQPVGIALTFLLFFFIFFYKPTWGATTWIWTAEIVRYLPLQNGHSFSLVPN